MAAEKSDPVVSCITVLSAGSTVTYFVVVSRARTQSKDVHFWRFHEYRSEHRRSSAGGSCCCTGMPGAAPLLSASAAWQGHPRGHRQGSASPSLTAEAAVLGTCLHCTAGTSLLGGQLGPASISRAPDIPGINFLYQCTMQTEYLHDVFLWHQHPDHSLNSPKELLLG